MGKDGGKAMKARELTHQKVRQVVKPGRYTDAGGFGLYLNVAKGGSKSWMQRLTVAGRRRDIGLGSCRMVTLAEARDKAKANRAAVMAGRDPVADRDRERPPTFAEAAIAAHAVLTAESSESHRLEWLAVLDRHAQALRDIRVDAITRQDVLRVLGPLDDRRETQQRLRHRIRAVLAWAQARGHIAGSNEAGECLNAALPQRRGERAHHAALDHADIPAAFAAIANDSATGLALRFAILTGARSGEATGARWAEVDLEAATWTLPGERMKGRHSHRVPLSRAALAVLEAARALGGGSDLIFQSPIRRGQAVTGQGLREALRCAGLAATVHGFRTSFRSWCADGDWRWDACEMALAHNVGGAVERSYQRSDLLEARRDLMQAWADHCVG